MKYNWQEKEDNIKNYSKHKILCELSKLRSYNAIKIIEDLNDLDFLYVLTYRKKSGLIVDNRMIIRKEYESWLSYLQNQLGWKK